MIFTYSDNFGETWKSLTGPQRSAWWDFAMDHPWYGWYNVVKIINGWQMFTYVNYMLGIADYAPLIKDPPTDLTRPDPISIQCSRWTVKSLLASGSSRYHGRLVVDVDPPLPIDRLLVFFQDWERYKKPRLVPVPEGVYIRRDSFTAQRAGVLYPGYSGQYDLASYGGRPISDGQRSDNIRGNWTRLRPNDPLGFYRVVNILNGFWTKVALTTAA